MHLGHVDVSRVPRYRRIPSPAPGRPPSAYTDALAVESIPESEDRKPLNWLVVAFLAWELSQVAIGVYYGVKLALVVT